MINLRLLSAFLLAILSFSVSAKEEVSISCGPSNGYSYYSNNGLTPSHIVGFREDGISKGNFLIKGTGKSWEIIHVDASGERYSVKEDGGEIIFLGVKGDTSLVWLLVYPKAVEVYSFRAAVGEVEWTKTSYGGVIEKTHMMKTKCVSN